MSQETAILEYLKKGNALTPMDALERFNCFRLGARIWDLKREGYDIRTETVKNGRKQYARYFMVRKERQLEFTN